MGVKFDLEAIAADVAIALASAMSRECKLGVIHWASWRWSGAQGKYVGCPYWSRAALTELKTRGPGRWGAWCSHEHVVPRKVIVGALLALAEPTAARVRGVMERLAIGCVVTREEDRRLSKGLRSKMPAGYEIEGDAMYLDVWARYRAAGIEWVGPLKWGEGGVVE